jgi:hypothetical protein
MVIRPVSVETELERLSGRGQSEKAQGGNDVALHLRHGQG